MMINRLCHWVVIKMKYLILCEVPRTVPGAESILNACELSLLGCGFPYYTWCDTGPFIIKHVDTFSSKG